NNARIFGRCGGYCGQCSPDKFKGLDEKDDKGSQQYCYATLYGLWDNDTKKKKKERSVDANP
ncbi:hypothetical protein WUBG_10553, partial [Wuchereria bancrofti]